MIFDRFHLPDLESFQENRAACMQAVRFGKNVAKIEYVYRINICRKNL